MIMCVAANVHVCMYMVLCIHVCLSFCVCAWHLCSVALCISIHQALCAWASACVCPFIVTLLEPLSHTHSLKCHPKQGHLFCLWNAVGWEGERRSHIEFLEKLDCEVTERYIHFSLHVCVSKCICGPFWLGSLIFQSQFKFCHIFVVKYILLFFPTAHVDRAWGPSLGTSSQWVMDSVRTAWFCSQFLWIEFLGTAKELRVSRGLISAVYVWCGSVSFI